MDKLLGMARSTSSYIFVICVLLFILITTSKAELPTTVKVTCSVGTTIYEQGDVYTPNKCQDVCMCNEDGQFHCLSCKNKIPKTTKKCHGWAHEIVTVESYVGSVKRGCKCSKYVCKRKSVSKLLKELWKKIKHKLSSIIKKRNAKRESQLDELDRTYTWG